MGQKLVTIKFISGSSEQLTDPGYNPKFRLTVVGDNLAEQQVTKYCSRLSGPVPPPEPVDPRALSLEVPLTNTVLQTMIKKLNYLTIQVDDGADHWVVYVQEDVLSPEESLLQAGTF